jgi:hypothetical protein
VRDASADARSVSRNQWRGRSFSQHRVFALRATDGDVATSSSSETSAACDAAAFEPAVFGSDA